MTTADNRATGEQGSATAEFTMVSALLALLFVAAVQVAGMIHVRNTLIDAASTGARFGALADRTADDGAARTQQLITGSISSRYAEEISYEYLETSEGRTLRISVRAQVPVLVVGPGFGELEVTGSAYEY
ncbi:TadE/TadG family type IV pilus assembly protein [Nesterenkonia muleiensis]|uniref:TadE/TadG family type IV pilus assembly protein n=1 Tax=Nesterenkonia muleiensis TaxID=2282648 RepID=UPI001EE4C7C1|nr:TadE/TadG family type IV pilus assembly protein [Nesterenkonia muleiensis]